MELHFDKWFKEIAALQARFNKSKDPVERFAIMTALTSDFENNIKWMKEECQRQKGFVVDSILKRGS